MDEGSLSLPPFTGYDEKSLRDYHLALRGNSLNPMIDAATPLLGMVNRVECFLADMGGSNESGVAGSDGRSDSHPRVFIQFFPPDAGKP